MSSGRWVVNLRVVSSLTVHYLLLKDACKRRRTPPLPVPVFTDGFRLYALKTRRLKSPRLFKSPSFRRHTWVASCWVTSREPSHLSLLTTHCSKASERREARRANSRGFLNPWKSGEATNGVCKDAERHPPSVWVMSCEPSHCSSLIAHCSKAPFAFWLPRNAASFGITHKQA